MNPCALDGPMTWQASRELNAQSTGGHPMIRLPRAAVWACAILLAMAFVLVGGSKFRRPLGNAMDREVCVLGLPRKFQICHRSLGSPRWSRGVDSQVETSRCGDIGRPHDWRAVHARRSRRVLSPHSAACPWRARVAVVFVARLAGRRTDATSRDWRVRRARPS